jgi:hypothetical protein
MMYLAVFVVLEQGTTTEGSLLRLKQSKDTLFVVVAVAVMV